MKRVKVGIIGAGNIFAQYVRGCRMYPILDLAACADLDMERASARAAEHEIPRACTVESLLADPDIEMVINLTVPKVHAEVSLAILAAGKHVYSEKPLAIERESGRALLDLADSKGLRVGCAPDTFLGGGLQTCRKLIDDGWIGEPVAVAAFFAAHGPEAWHPNPFFFYEAGAGPLFDMGPYYLTALVTLLGPIESVTSIARASFSERIATSAQHFGARIPVSVPTHISGALQFAAGPAATFVASFDVWDHHLPRIEIYGSEGSLSVPDPNTFHGPVLVRRASAETWTEAPLSHPTNMQRGIGPADMAYAIRTGRPHRASGALAYHVLDAMHALVEASDRRTHIALQSMVERPAPIPTSLLPGTLDA
ncbi:MAG: Gfo/Idh/MocA family oxidoreductase [Anaerolineae bacterium]|nr:Gfo/Idh/MocA family oxidoreductase [Anaerolineae bacterium]